MSCLLAISDVLVVSALERACSRGLTGEQRRLAGRHGLKYRAYETVHIPVGRHDRALDGAWMQTIDLAARWELPVDAVMWAITLDTYARGLLATMTAHTVTGLDEALSVLGSSHAR